MDSTYINLDTLRRRRRRRLFEVEGLELHWDIVNLDWCAGHNPPSVQRQHSAKRATRTSRRHLTGAYLPFHLAGQPFHRSPLNILNTLNVHHSTSVERGVPFLRCCQGSRPAPYASATTSAWWAEFPHAQMSATAVRQLTNPKYE
jgi:hypothetical protein